MIALNLLNTKRDFLKDLERVKIFSEKIDKKLSNSNIPDDSKIDKLTLEELQDLSKIAGLANFMLCKYEEKKETRSILQYFVSLIVESTESIEGVDDEISELIISAEDSINKIKDMYANISKKSDLADGPKTNCFESDECGSINLTNFAIDVNTLGYQQNSQQKAVQVI